MLTKKMIMNESLLLLKLTIVFITVSYLLFREDKMLGESVSRNFLALIYMLLFVIDLVISIAFITKSMECFTAMNIVLILSVVYLHERSLQKFYYLET